MKTSIKMKTSNKMKTSINMKTSNKMKTIKLLALLFISILTFSNCSNDDNENENEEELITTVIYTLTNGVNNDVVMTYEDIDGQGGADGSYIVNGALSANSTYTGSILLLNKTEDPAENVTEEIEEEAEEHEFFYKSNLVTVTKTDLDENDNPIGLTTTLTTGAEGTGELTIVLKHEPAKPNDGTAQGAGGSTDIEVTFEIAVL